MALLLLVAVAVLIGSEIDEGNGDDRVRVVMRTRPSRSHSTGRVLVVSDGIPRLCGRSSRIKVATPWILPPKPVALYLSRGRE